MTQFSLKNFLLMALTACCSSQQINASTPDQTKQNDVSINVAASGYSPVQSINSFTDDWDEPLQAGDQAFLQGRVGMTYQPADQSFIYGANWRYDYLMSFSEPMAETYWHYKNEQTPKANRHYDLQLSASHNERVGIAFGKQVQLIPNWHIIPKLNLWQGKHAIEGDFIGQLNTLANVSPKHDLVDSLDNANANLTYHYDRPALHEERLDWHPKRPTGYGYSLDLQVQGQLPYDTELTLTAYDILGRMMWKDMPKTDYRLTYDVLGRPPYTLEGQLSQQDYWQALPWQIESRLEKQLTPAWHIGLQSEFNEVAHLHQLQVSYLTPIFNNNLELTGMIEPQTKAVGIGVQGRHFNVIWLTDDLNTNKATRIQLHLSASYKW